MVRRTLSFILTVVLLGVLGNILLSQIPARPASAQTIPSRTPTPSGAEPTSTGGTGGSLPTATRRQPQPTATFTPMPLPPTPEDGFLPTAVPCDSAPTVRSRLSGANVRSGPGLAYEIVADLLLGEVRPIIGRAEYVSWWQITLADGTTGWIAGSVVLVNGYVGSVPVVEAPALESGTTVTPGTPWAPTPRPDCTPVPTPVATPTPTPSPEGLAATGTAQVENIGDPGKGGPEETATSPAGEEPVTAATEVSELPATRVIPTAEPLPTEGDEAPSMSWIPLVGIALILAAGGIFLAQRLRG